jgi:hypothetical protein
MAVVLTSTTSPQAELEHGVSETWRDPFVPEGEKLEEKPKAEEPVVEAEPEAEPEVAPKPKEHKSGWQKRIDKLTARNHMLESKVAEYEAKQKLPEEKTEPKATGEPKLADFNNNVEEFLKARDAWKENSEKQAVELERRKATVDGYNEKVSQARGNYEDWDEVVSGSKIIIPQAAVDAVIELDNGPDVAYYLAQHPEEAEALMDLTPIRTIQVIGKLSDKVAGERAPAPPKAKAKAPEPIAPVGGSATRSSVNLDQLPPREYIKIRNKQERESKRGY